MPLRNLCFSTGLLAVFALGCQSTPATVEALPHVSAAVPAEFETAWAATRETLQQQGYQIYLRDKRGMFVAYTPTKRKLIFFPHRTKMTVTLRQDSAAQTTIAVETIRQHYRVTLLTYPDWRDVPGSADEAAGQALLDAIVAHSTGETAEPGPEA